MFFLWLTFCYYEKLQISTFLFCHKLIVSNYDWSHWMGRNYRYLAQVSVKEKYATLFKGFTQEKRNIQTLVDGLHCFTQRPAPALSCPTKLKIMYVTIFFVHATRNVSIKLWSISLTVSKHFWEFSDSFWDNFSCFFVLLLVQKPSGFHTYKQYKQSIAQLMPTRDTDFFLETAGWKTFEHLCILTAYMFDRKNHDVFN